MSFGTATLPSKQGGLRKGVLPSVTPFYSEHSLKSVICKHKSGSRAQPPPSGQIGNDGVVIVK